MTGHIATMQQLEELHNFFSVDSSSVNAQHNNDGGVVSAVNGRKPRETPLNQKIDVVKDNGRLPMSSVEYHIVFSTGCNAFQDWQSYVFFYQIMKSGQSGHVTRVASGCTEEGARSLLRVFAEQIQTLPNGKGRFHLHLTPDYSKTAGIDFKFFNKPFGLLHWMEHQMGWSIANSTAIPKGTIVVVLDPDQFLMRPFVANFTGDATAVWHKPELRSKQFAVEEGRPFGQFYGFGAEWIRQLNKNMSKVVREVLHATVPQQPMDANSRESSHLYHWTASEVINGYVAGPPYIAVASDMYKIVKAWAAVVVPVYELTQDHLSEMFAYSTGAAHMELPHQLAYSFMVSSPEMSRQEGWAPIDKVAKPEDVCRYVRSDVTKDPVAAAWVAQLPQVVHYCQRYFLGPYFFSKYKLPKDFLSCGQPLLKDPLDHEGTNFAALYDSSVTPNNQLNRLSPVDIKRHAFMLCYIIAIINEAISYWKQQHCKPDDDPNYSKEFLFPKDPIKKR